MSDAIVISADSARIIAAAVRPQIKAYIEQNRDKYEAFLRAECNIALDAVDRCSADTTADRKQGV